MDSDLSFDYDEMSPSGSKIFELYEKIHELVDEELMKFDISELKMIQLVYGDNFFYPINTHVNKLMDGTPSDEILH
jgi:hypothetical protein